MSARIDVRRTAGGLRLLVPAYGVPRRSVRLSYAQAGDLITAIRAGQVRSVAGDVAVAPFTEHAEDAGPCAVLADACAGTYLREQDLRALGNDLCAHMPDRMTPLP
ncbi:hypothetical protein ACFWY9_01745 [Amycolatopsis sp. NPDC059027]|uniref:hypothetical protein n=1 Tax=unclassified Amycolatopsis TaxID=2618356 RepID=UPI00366BCDFB